MILKNKIRIYIMKFIMNLLKFKKIEKQIIRKFDSYYLINRIYEK